MISESEKALVKQHVRADELYAEYHPENVRRGPHDLCAWHHDTSPSLARHKDRMQCFGACKKVYDIYAIERKAKGCDFETAHKNLMARAGLSSGNGNGNRAALEKRRAIYPHRETEIIPIARRSKTGFRAVRHLRLPKH